MEEYRNLLDELIESLDRKTFKDFEILHWEICDRMDSINAETIRKIQELFGYQQNFVRRYILIMTGIMNSKKLNWSHTIDPSKADASVAPTRTPVTSAYSDVSTHKTPTAIAQMQHDVSNSNTFYVHQPSVSDPPPYRNRCPLKKKPRKKKGTHSNELKDNVPFSPFPNQFPPFHTFSKEVSYSSHKFSLPPTNLEYGNSPNTTGDIPETVNTPVASPYYNAASNTTSSVIPPIQRNVSNSSTSDVFQPAVPDLPSYRSRSPLNSLEKRYTPVNTPVASDPSPVASAYSNSSSNTIPAVIPAIQRNVSNSNTSDVYKPAVPDHPSYGSRSPFISLENRCTPSNVLYENIPNSYISNCLPAFNVFSKNVSYVCNENDSTPLNAACENSDYVIQDISDYTVRASEKMNTP